MCMYMNLLSDELTFYTSKQKSMGKTLSIFRMIIAWFIKNLIYRFQIISIEFCYTLHFFKIAQRDFDQYPIERSNHWYYCLIVTSNSIHIFVLNCKSLGKNSIVIGKKKHLAYYTGGPPPSSLFRSIISY